MTAEVSVRKNYQWWREYATSTENHATNGQDASVSEQPDYVHAQQRAAAAAMIAEEANAARLKALLDAAREQADQNSIRSAEKRFNEARDDWETAREAISTQGKPSASEGTAPDTPFVVEIADAVNRVLKRISPEQKAISLGVVIALMLGVGVGTGGYFMLNGSPGGLTSPDRIAAASDRPLNQPAPERPVNASISDKASSDAPVQVGHVPAGPIIIPAATKVVAAPGPAAKTPKAAVAPRKPKRVYSITLPAASAKSATESNGQTARRSTPDIAIRVNTRPSGVSRAPVAPPAPNPRLAVTEPQVIPPPPPKPPVQSEEAE